MIDFIRPFTEKEFNKVFHEAGYPEIAKQYCREIQVERFNDILNDEISEDDLKDLPQLITDLKTQEHWTADTVREQAWNYVKENSDIDIYVQQREMGHGHEWAKQICEQLIFHSIDDAEIYWNAYEVLRCNDVKSNEESGVRHKWEDCCNSDTISCKEYTLAVKNLAKGNGAIVERYIDDRLSSIYNNKTEDLLKEALHFRELYDNLIKEGYDENVAFDYAEDLSEEHYPVFYDIYREAMRHGENNIDAWLLADFCEEQVVNGYLYSEISHFKEKFNKPWQCEIYAGLIIKDMIESEGSISTLHENEIRTMLDLKPTDKSLTWEDEEFLRLKKEYIEKGLNEVVAEQRAYKEVYENDGDIAIDKISHNHARDFNREMLEMMFPNEDIDSEDFEDGLDMEDMYD